MYQCDVPNVNRPIQGNQKGSCKAETITQLMDQLIDRKMICSYSDKRFIVEFIFQTEKTFPISIFYIVRMSCFLFLM